MAADDILYAALRAVFDASIEVRPIKAEATDGPEFIVYRLIIRAPQNTLAGKGSIARYQYQLDAYAASPARAEQLAGIAESALTGSPQLAALPGTGVPGYDFDAKLYRYRQDFSFWL